MATKTIHPVYSLGYYTELVKIRSDSDLYFARTDLAKTIPLWDRNPGPYLDRLYNERDAVLRELQKRGRI